MRNPLSLKRLVVSLGLILLLTGTAEALTKKIEGTTNIEDTYMNSANVNNNYGSIDSWIMCYLTTYGFLIRPKNVASELGENATITACVCSLYITTSSSVTAGAYRVFKPWVEGTQDDEVCTGGVNYLEWQCDGDLEWTSANCMNADDEGVDNSGDGTGADKKETPEDTEAITDVGWYAWDISAELAQAWYDGTANENGLVFHRTEGAGYPEVASTEHGTAEYRPHFTFTYTTDGEPAAGQVIIIGARDEEDFHNPRRGIPPAAWE